MDKELGILVMFLANMSPKPSPKDPKVFPYTQTGNAVSLCGERSAGGGI